MHWPLYLLRNSFDREFTCTLLQKLPIYFIITSFVGTASLHDFQQSSVNGLLQQVCKLYFNLNIPLLMFQTQCSVNPDSGKQSISPRAPKFMLATGDIIRQTRILQPSRYRRDDTSVIHDATLPPTRPVYHYVEKLRTVSRRVKVQGRSV